MTHPSDSSDQVSAPAMPRWVKVAGIIALALILLVGILHLTGMNPMHHMPATPQQGQQP